MSNLRYCEIHQHFFVWEEGCDECARSDSAQRLNAAISAARNPRAETFEVAAIEKPIAKA